MIVQEICKNLYTLIMMVMESFIVKMEVFQFG